MNTNIHEKLLYKELSYQIQGTAIEVRKNFGSGLKESIYQNVFAEELKSRNLSFEKEKSIQIFSPKTGKLVGSYRPDFIVDGKILVELKAVEKIPKMFIDQLYSYLKNSEYELGYFINFASPRLYIKRIIFTNDRKPFLPSTRRVADIRRVGIKLSCLLVSLFVSFSVFALSAQAAEIFYSDDVREVRAGTEFEIGVFLNAESENINAIEGILRFPADILEFKELNDGNSIVNFWVEQPILRAENEIVFSGITPGGFPGTRGLIFRITFLARNEGNGKLEMQNIKALLNDGKGTAADISVSPLKIIVTKQALSLPPQKEEKDQEPPESFKPEVARDPSIFDGKWFLVFATQDKGSGVDRYEIQETRYRIFESFSTPLEASRLGRLPIFRWIGLLTGSRWISSESPYGLRDQKLRSYIFVKAIDKAGNVRIEKILPRNPLHWYKNYENWIIIVLLGLAIAYAIKKFLWKKLNTKLH